MAVHGARSPPRSRSTLLPGINPLGLEGGSGGHACGSLSPSSCRSSSRCPRWGRARRKLSARPPTRQQDRCRRSSPCRPARRRPPRRSQPRKAAEKEPPIPRAKPAETQHYATVPVAERRAIQSDLVWTGDYNGVPSDEFGDRVDRRREVLPGASGAAETGILTPEQRAALAAAAKAKQEAVGWRMVDDAVTGVRLGIPAKRVRRVRRRAAPARAGARHVARCRSRRSASTSRHDARRRVRAAEEGTADPAGSNTSIMRDNFFVLSGQQGLKRFYVRAHVKDNEVRGMTILYDQAMMGIMDPITVAMSSRFDPFPIAVGRRAAQAPGRVRHRHRGGSRGSRGDRPPGDRRVQHDHARGSRQCRVDRRRRRGRAAARLWRARAQAGRARRRGREQHRTSPWSALLIRRLRTAMRR